MNPRVQNKRLKRIENRPHYRLKNEQEKLDKLIFESLSDYTYSYDFLDEFRKNYPDKTDAVLRRVTVIEGEEAYVAKLIDISVVLKFLKVNLSKLMNGDVLTSVDYGVKYSSNKENNDYAFECVKLLSNNQINEFVNAFLCPLEQAKFSKDRIKTNYQEFDDLMDCIIQTNELKISALQRNWKQIVDEHNQKLKQR